MTTDGHETGTPDVSGTTVDHFSVVLTLGLDRTALRLAGELDMAAAPTLQDCFEKACAADNSIIVFDLHELTFCDSGGIRALLMAAAHCAKAGTDMRLVGVQDCVRRVIEITHTAEALHLDDHRTDDQP
jgi:anti-anti-sigma factor